MKKTILTLCLTALIALPLAGCSSNKTGEHPVNTVSPSPTAPAVTPGNGLASSDITNTLPPVGSNATGNNGQDDLAGPDGIVGGDNGADNTEGNVTGRSGRSALERVGDGIRDTVDDIGHGVEDTIEDMGRGARSAADQMGRSAQDMGQAARRALQ